MFEERRKRLLSSLQSPSDVIVLFSGFESWRHRFRPSSSCWYLTGIEDPGIAVVINMNGDMVSYVPNYGVDRSRWAGGVFIGGMSRLGDPVLGYVIEFPPTDGCMKILASDLKQVEKKGGRVLLVQHEYSQKLLKWCLEREGVESFGDVSDELAKLRRVKDDSEIEMIRKSVEISSRAYDVVSESVADGMTELRVMAAAERAFIESGADRPAFPTIVASAENATVLHHTPSRRVMRDGEVVLVDMGAECGMYTSDMTRTFPVSGVFTPRQRELHKIVLEVQKIVEDCAKPGWFLRNEDRSEVSLHHRAVEEFRKYGFDFVHGIGHSIGLDVHDLDDSSLPLEAGMTFTIEPGVYLPDEGVGIRIEDDFVVQESGVKRLC